MFRTVSILALATIAMANALSADASDFLLREQFEEFKAKFGKSYDSQQEEDLRLEVFAQNVENVAKMTVEDKTSVYGITKFFDLTEDEFKYFYLNYRPSNVRKQIPVHSSKTSAPSNWDWRDQTGVLTDVKDQGQCGSCWAFSAVETVESAWALAGNDLTVFSEQQVVSCDADCYGCGGGWTEKAFDYIESAGGLATEADYPYVSGVTTQTGTCSSFSVSGGQVSGYEYATTPCTSFRCNNQDEDTLAANLASEQPISICVDASKWSYYTGGVMTTDSCSSSYYSQDHCVQLVGYNGYGTSDGYWIVRNSWASDWGEDGFIYLQMGTNTCGVADDANMVNVA